jgi:hypothetical protein
MNALYPDIRAFVSIPPLVITKNDRGTSTIQTGTALADLPKDHPGDR